jgi:hypothetical protein
MIKQETLFDEPITIGMNDIKYGRINTDIIEDEIVIETMFKYFRERGFPYYEKQIPQLTIKELTNSKLDVKNNVIEQDMIGCGCANYYFPHMWEVRCNNHLSSMDIFNDDDKFKTVLKKVWRWCIKHENSKVSMNRIRQGLKIYGGAYAVSNFRPSVAKYIYETYGGDKVWDMCAGWGGRLLGALSSRNIKEYYGTDASTKTYLGLMEMKKEFNFIDKKIVLECTTCEDYVPEYKLDLCFTSPPYYDTEKYADEPTQSYNRYKTYERWLNDFLYMTIDNCHMALKDTGILALNIANTTNYKTIESDTKEIFKDVGFKLIKTYKMVLSSIAGKGIKYEPIFICKKQGE